MQDDLPKLAEGVLLSRSAERLIKQNVLVSLLIKVLYVLLGPFGLVALWRAVVADMGISRRDCQRAEVVSPRPRVEGRGSVLISNTRCKYD